MSDTQELDRCVALIKEHYLGAVMSKYATIAECQAARQMAKAILRAVAGDVRAERELAPYMSRARFLELQAELELRERAIEKGEESEGTDSRIEELTQLINAAPWMMHPDYGCVEKASDR